MICDACGGDKSFVWFRDPGERYSQPCHHCRMQKERESAWQKICGLMAAAAAIVTTAVVTKIVEEKLELGEIRCHRCRNASEPCRVCLLIGKHRKEVEQRDKIQNVVSMELENIPISAVERTRFERFSILCQRCKNRVDPRTKAIVAAVCSDCVLPCEVKDFWRLHNEWNRPREKSLAK